MSAIYIKITDDNYEIQHHYEKELKKMDEYQIRNHYDLLVMKIFLYNATFI